MLKAARLRVRIREFLNRLGVAAFLLLRRFLCFLFLGYWFLFRFRPSPPAAHAAVAAAAPVRQGGRAAPFSLWSRLMRFRRFCRFRRFRLFLYIRYCRLLQGCLLFGGLGLLFGQTFCLFLRTLLLFLFRTRFLILDFSISRIFGFDGFYITDLAVSLRLHFQNAVENILRICEKRFVCF